MCGTGESLLLWNARIGWTMHRYKTLQQHFCAPSSVLYSNFAGGLIYKNGFTIKKSPTGMIS